MKVKSLMGQKLQKENNDSVLDLHLELTETLSRWKSGNPGCDYTIEMSLGDEEDIIEVVCYKES